MGDVAAPEKKNPLVAQAAKGPRELVMLPRREPLVEVELNHGNVGSRKEMHQHRPDAVVETTAVVESDPVFSQERAHSLRELRLSGRGVLDLVQRPGETAEIVDRRRMRIGRDPGALDEPVGRDREHRSRSGEEGCELAESAAPAVVLDGVHRRAVADEERRHPGIPIRRGGHVFAGPGRRDGVIPSSMAAS